MAVEPDIRGNEAMARFKENFNAHVTVEKNLLGDKVWVVHDADKLSAKDLSEIRDAATARGASVELATTDRNRSVSTPDAPGLAQQAREKAAPSFDPGGFGR